MLIGAEVDDLLDLSTFEAEDQALGEVQAAGFFAPAAVVVDHVVAVFNDHQGLGLEVGLAELVEEGQHFVDAALGARQWVVTGDGPADVTGHHLANAGDVLGDAVC